MKTYDVPDEIPLSKLQAFVADLGIPTKYLREVVISLDEVHVEFAAVDEKGLLVSSNGDISIDRISFRVNRDS